MDNFLQSLIPGTQDMPEDRFAASRFPAPQAPQAPTAAEQPRKKVSTLDLVGTILDGIASMGGSEPQYWPTINARAKQQQDAQNDAAKNAFYQAQTYHTNMDAATARAKLVAPLAERALLAYKNAGPQGLEKILPAFYQTLHLTPDEVNQYHTAIMNDPEGMLGALSSYGKEDKAPTYALQPVRVINRATGETRLIQMASNGGMRYDTLPQGFEIADPLQFVDQGTQIQPTSKQTAAPVADPVPVSGRPAVGDVQVPSPTGAPTNQFYQAPGSQAYQERMDKATEGVNKTQGLSVAFDAADREIAGLEKEIEVLKNAGGMTGVKGQGWLGNAQAWAYQNIPGYERITNSDAGSARKSIDTITTNLSTNLGNAIKEATNAGVPMTSRLMDTPAEVQRFKDAITNADDYKSAVDALKEFKTFVTESRKLLRQQIVKSQARKNQVGRAPSNIPVSEPTISNW